MKRSAKDHERRVSPEAVDAAVRNASQLHPVSLARCQHTEGFFRSATQPTMMCDAERVFSAGLNRAAAEQMALSCAAFRADPTKILYKEQIAREP